ncbi:hypothetical protein JW921_00860 [Candidatus Fermentibacterales bacterium]|nr:hypothetical protein [Candidatus Fermentibacterales bacterium]
MKCPNCGAGVSVGSDGACICSYCGSSFLADELGGGPSPAPERTGQAPVVIREIHHYHDKPDRLPAALGCLFLLFFPAGIVYYIIMKQDYPRRARTALIVSIVALIVIALGRGLGN